jgi:trans-2,3-dihydro-3-hydroxyanthranilate isomerase
MPSWTPNRSFQYLHYDVFTGTPLEGNQLAVFLDGRGLPTERMQSIAREMNFSESTFILPAETPGTDVRMRIFTPNNEMPMAGHPTIGSTFALAESGVIPPGAARWVFGLNVGPTPVDLQWKDGRLSFAWMTQLVPEFGEPVTARADVAAALGLTEADLVARLPIQPISCGVPFLYVPLKDAATVDRAVSDANGFRRLKAATGIDLAIFLFAWNGSSVYSRMFAPEFGVSEDPATGSASGPLGCYLVRHGVVSGEAAHRIRSLQGAKMQRPSHIFIDITELDGAIVDVKIGGTAVLVGRGELIL